MGPYVVLAPVYLDLAGVVVVVGEHLAAQAPGGPVRATPEGKAAADRVRAATTDPGSEAKRGKRWHPAMLVWNRLNCLPWVAYQPSSLHIGWSLPYPFFSSSSSGLVLKQHQHMV